jgi:hypothetical protein
LDYLKLQRTGAATGPDVANDVPPLASIAGLLLLFTFRETTIMTEHSLWRFSRALHRAINERQLEDIETLIDEDVEWAIFGPIDMFPFLGSRHGKAAVMEVIRQIAENFRIHRFAARQLRPGGAGAGASDSPAADVVVRLMCRGAARDVAGNDDDVNPARHNVAPKLPHDSLSREAGAHTRS